MSADLITRGQALDNRRLASLRSRLPWLARIALIGFLIGGSAGIRTAESRTRDLATGYVQAQLYELKHPFFRLRQDAESRRAVWWVDHYSYPTSPWRQAAETVMWRAVKVGGAGAFLFTIIFYLLLRRRWIAAAQADAREQVMRGGRVVTARELARLMPADTGRGAITIGSVPIPKGDEDRHMLVAGRTGSGKSTLLRAMAYQIEARCEHALVYDPDGSAVARFYNSARGDIILNPFDARSARWEPFADVRSEADAMRLASFIVPKPANAGDGGTWYDQAREVTAAVIDRLRRDGRGNLDELAITMRTANAAALRDLVFGTAAARAFEPGAEKATASVLFTLTQAARILSLLAAIPADRPTFSFDAFYSTLSGDGPQPWVFLAAPKRSIEAARPVLAAWVDAAASAVLERPPGRAARAWFMLDELASLPRVASLLTVMPEGRKYGAAVVVAFQSIAQLRDTYGDKGASIITGQAVTQIVMATGDAETARWASDLFGCAEVEVRRATDSLDAGKLTVAGSSATHRETKPLVLDSQLAALRLGEGFIRTSGYPVARFKGGVEHEARPERATSFIPGPTTHGSTMVGLGSAPTRLRLEDGDDWLTAGGL
jgi:type IV secretory pathway TraG/TraD family ATPase VirD4